MIAGVNFKPIFSFVSRRIVFVFTEKRCRQPRKCENKSTWQGPSLWNLAAKIVTAQKWTFVKNKWWNNSTVFAFFLVKQTSFWFFRRLCDGFRRIVFLSGCWKHKNFLRPSVCKRAFHIPHIYQTYVTKTRSATIWMERCAYYSLAGWTPEHHIAQRAYHEHTSMSRLPCQVEWTSNGWIFLVSPVHG